MATLDNKYSIKLIESMDEWQKISGPWNKLLVQSQSDTIFLTWEWLYTWGEHYLNKDRGLLILVVYENNEIVGIAPWYINSFRFGPFFLKQIEFLGTPETGSDYLDVFIKGRKERDVTQLIYHYLFHKIVHQWDLLILRGMPAHSLFLLNFLNELKRDGKYYEVRDGAFCPFIVLPESREGFSDILSQNRRKRFMYDMRVLKKGSEVNYQTFLPGNDDITFKRFISLYKNRWGEDKKPFYSFIEKFLSRGSENKWVCIDLLNVDGEDVAGLLLLQYQGTVSMYLMAADINYNKKISVGNILVGLSIERAINNNFSVYDFLKGDEEYKFYCSREGKRCLNLLASRRSLGTIFFISVKLIKNIAKVILR